MCRARDRVQDGESSGCRGWRIAAPSLDLTVSERPVSGDDGILLGAGVRKKVIMYPEGVFTYLFFINSVVTFIQEQEDRHLHLH